MKKSWLIGLSVFTLVVLVSCTAQSSPPANTPSADVVDWRSAQLTDVLTGATFTIEDFSDKPILVESFAVWCPTCTRQQEKIKELHDLLGDTVVSISLDTDPNEDETIVRNHAEAHGFDWFYVVSPPDLTRSLIAEFGNPIINAPQAPLVLVCPDGSASLLDRGVKDVAELQVAIAGCA